MKCVFKMILFIILTGFVDSSISSVGNGVYEVLLLMHLYKGHVLQQMNDRLAAGQNFSQEKVKHRKQRIASHQFTNQTIFLSNWNGTLWFEQVQGIGIAVNIIALTGEGELFIKSSFYSLSGGTNAHQLFRCWGYSVMFVKRYHDCTIAKLRFCIGIWRLVNKSCKYLRWFTLD